jgi:hypothetical protein
VVVFQEVEEEEPARSGGRLQYVSFRSGIGGGILAEESCRRRRGGWKQGRIFGSRAFAAELHPTPMDLGVKN